MISQLLINTLTGAGTGYITNNIAIKMLFKKYFGRFGGMIEDTHEEFVENISALIEKDLINHSTLADEFQSEKFRNYIKELVKDMFTHSLMHHSIKLKNIQGIDATRDNALMFLHENHHHVNNVKHQLASKPFKDALSHLQLLHFSKNLATTINTNKSTYLSEFLIPLKSFQLNDLITEELLKQLSQNIQNIINSLEFQKYDSNINETVEKILTAIEIDSLLAVIKEEVENIYVKQIFKDQEQGVKNLIDTFIKIALTDEGKEAINESVTAILENIKTVDSSVLNLLDDSIKLSIKTFIQTELPQIIGQIIAFIDKNEKELEELINASIDNALSDGAFASIKKKFISIFYTNIVQDFQVLQKVKAFMHQHQEKAEEEIVKQLLDILENKSIGELYTFISQKKIVTPEKISTLVIDNLGKLQTHKKFNLIDIALKKQVKEYTKLDMKFVTDNIIPYGLQELKKNYLYSTGIKKLINHETQNLINNFKTKTIHEILGTRLDTITDTLLMHINEDNILNIILSNAAKILDKPINNTINMDDIDLDYKKYIDELIATKSIKDIIIQLQSEEVYEALEVALIKVIVDNLEEILEGNVSEAVKNELTKLPPSQIKDMVEEFMGEELKPINYFGAFLGGITGAGVGVLGIPTYANPLIYSVVGVATNYLAIKMLFQPYTPLKIANFKVPLSQGVLPSNKAKMAVKMSEFVDEFMLNGNSIQDFFTNNSEDLKSFIKKNIVQDNYSIIDKLIHQNSNTDDISNEAINLIFSFLDKNETMIAEKIFTISMSYYEKRKEYATSATAFIFNKAMQVDFSTFLYEQFESFIDHEKSLSFVTPDIIKELEKFRDTKFDYFLTLLSQEEQLKKFIAIFEPNFEYFIQNKSLDNLLNHSIKKSINSKVNSSLINLFYGHGTINEFLNFFTKGEFGSNTRLSDMINGMLPQIIQRNLNRIIEEAVLPTLRENKKLIRSEIMKKMPFGVGWVAKHDINKTIDIILDVKVPAFIDKKIEEINLIIQDMLDTKITDLGYTENVINQKKVDDLITSILASESFNASLEKSMLVFINSIFSLKLEEILKIFDLKTLLDIYNLFKPQIQVILKRLQINISNNKSEIFQIISQLINDNIIPDILNNFKIKDILKNVDKSMWLREFYYLQKNLKSSDTLNATVKKILDTFITVFIKEEFLDKKIFKKDLNRFLAEIIKDKEELRGVFLPFFKAFIANINEMLDLKLKDHMLQIIINAAFESINAKIVALIGAVDFKRVITKEIEAMHPKELEDMFYSFAGPYFNKLILYGALGFVFGLFTLIEV